MWKYWQEVTAFIVGSLLMTGCTMFVQEPTQTVLLSSTPSAATVYVDGALHAESTPVSLTLDPRRSHAVRVEKPCYATTPVKLQPGMGSRSFGTYTIPVSQLPPTVHVDLRSVCGG